MLTTMFRKAAVHLAAAAPRKIEWVTVYPDPPRQRLGGTKGKL